MLLVPAFKCLINKTVERMNDVGGIYIAESSLDVTASHWLIKLED